MNVLVDIGHPAHVHFFRYAIGLLRDHGHNVHVVARDLEVARRLLDAYAIDYDIVSRKRRGKCSLAWELIEHNVRTFVLVRKMSIDVVVSIGGTYMIYAACLAGCKSLVFTDTETARLANAITFPFADRILTPVSYPRDCGSRHIRYNGYHELAYLYPARFSPSCEVLSKYGLSTDDRFGLVRLCSWEAAHDVGVRAADYDEKVAMLKMLSDSMRVVVIAEGNEAGAIRDFTVQIDPQDFHHLLYFACLCVTEGATTATEASLLGTPSLYINPLRPSQMYEVSRYGLLEMSDPAKPLPEQVEAFMNKYLADAGSAGWNDKMIEDHCDVTAMIVEQVDSVGK